MLQQVKRETKAARPAWRPVHCSSCEKVIGEELIEVGKLRLMCPRCKTYNVIERSVAVAA